MVVRMADPPIANEKIIPSSPAKQRSFGGLYQPQFVASTNFHGRELDFSRPGRPTDNAFIESFNGKFRAECLNAHWFMSLDDARRKCEAWAEGRPRRAIGNKAPSELIGPRHTARADGPGWKKPSSLVQGRGAVLT